MSFYIHDEGGRFDARGYPVEEVATAGLAIYSDDDPPSADAEEIEDTEALQEALGDVHPPYAPVEAPKRHISFQDRRLAAAIAVLGRVVTDAMDRLLQHPPPEAHDLLRIAHTVHNAYLGLSGVKVGDLTPEEGYHVREALDAAKREARLEVLDALENWLDGDESSTFEWIQAKRQEYLSNGKVTTYG